MPLTSNEMPTTATPTPSPRAPAAAALAAVFGVTCQSKQLHQTGGFNKKSCLSNSCSTEETPWTVSTPDLSLHLSNRTALRAIPQTDYLLVNAMSEYVIYILYGLHWHASASFVALRRHCCPSGGTLVSKKV